MNKHDWHWLAGIWEGEGTACITSNRIVVTVSQKDISMLEEIRRLTETGSIHNGNGAKIWIIASKAARQFLSELKPFVRSKRRQEQISHVLNQDLILRVAGKERQLASNKRRGNLRDSLGRYC